jgi:uncharacterized protein YjbI with pentapeptide repeats
MVKSIKMVKDASRVKRIHTWSNKEPSAYQRTRVKPPLNLQATLNGALCAGTHLAEADLTRASLAGATLTKANLTGANLTDAVCSPLRF